MGGETWAAPHLHFLGDEVVQPAGVDVVVLEALGLQEVDEVLHGGPEVAPDGQLLQGHHHVPGGGEAPDCSPNSPPGLPAAPQEPEQHRSQEGPESGTLGPSRLSTDWPGDRGLSFLIWKMGK